MKIALCLPLFIFSFCAYGQGVLNESWFITREGIQAQLDVAWGVEVDANDDIYWASSQSVSGFDVKDIYVYKLGAQGNEIWDAPYVYGGLYEQQAYNCALKNGVLYVGGRTWTGYFSLNFSDALLFALDTLTKDTLWTFSWDSGFGYEEIDGIAVEDDAIYITGWTQGETTNQDALLIKLDLDGNLQWVNTWGSPGYDQCDGHCIVDDDNIYISGLFGLAGADAFLAAFDKNTGQYKWHQLWGGTGIEDALGMGSDGAYIYQCGITNSYEDASVFVIKYDKNGNKIWEALTDKAFKTRSMAFADDGTLYLAATTNTLGAGAEDLIIMQYNAETGALIEYKTWGGSANESVQDIRIKGNYLYLSGRTISYSANAFDDALLIKAPLFGISSTAAVASSLGAVELYPNPFSEQVVFKFGKKRNTPYTLHLFNVHGQTVKSVYNINSPQITVKRKQLDNGIYFYRVLDGSKLVASGKVLIL